jgi:BolA protein
MNNRMQEIEMRLKNALNPVKLEIEDEGHQHAGHAGAQSGLGYFAIQISSPMLSGKSRVEQHRMIYQALGDMMKTDIHALRISVE